MSMGWPSARAGQAVGLLGGSFDPAHEGHLAITREAIRRFRLDRVWWMVSPGNPLKERRPAPMAQRIAQAETVARHPKICVTPIETLLGTRHTAQTLDRLRARYVGVDFVWLMGADNLVQLHEWRDWHHIVQTVPMGVFARPGDRLGARLSRAARIYRGARLPMRAAPLLARAPAPAWCFVNLPMSSASSTAIRAAGNWSPCMRKLVKA
ncbi:nicotinate-nucleotide adenylyltransferase [Limimaricola cinnabarinus]|jgi:nicotinate-nucleotide adenylyltransferase|uniref:Probable nicotinate-nucleotide adenylyltransferase n=1 Tax=Limimaricola cinnabarinus TaxID=1125964 RepID=A0A2G1MEQ0_9RHOB|nr:nicotinate-nucleotide adenylyltransferase [Limimaricola cinnabarinus]PHP27228.1 nicotinic acid mononucleotide adenylyltransferase [Limimaricola cinnabarinus]